MSALHFVKTQEQRAAFVSIPQSVSHDNGQTINLILSYGLNLENNHTVPVSGLCPIFNKI